MQYKIIWTPYTNSKNNVINVTQIVSKEINLPTTIILNKTLKIHNLFIKCPNIIHNLVFGNLFKMKI